MKYVKCNTEFNIILDSCGSWYSWGLLECRWCWQLHAYKIWKNWFFPKEVIEDKNILLITTNNEMTINDNKEVLVNKDAWNSNNKLVWPYSWYKSIKTKNCLFIWDYAWADILEWENIVIIWDNIRSLDQKDNKNALFLTDRVAIWTKLFWKDINLKDVLYEYISKEYPIEEDIVEKILQDWIWTHWEQRAIYWREAEKLLKKHLSSK